MEFEYEPLQPGEIRLLQFISPHPKHGQDVSTEQSDKIHCILHHVSLAEVDKWHYNALSYTWGDRNEHRDVFIGHESRKLQICANLEAALKVFRCHLKEPWSYADVDLDSLDSSDMFWIDAICINQADKRERSQQIMLMRMVYQRATRLLIWLGNEYDNSNQAMLMISVIAKKALSDPFRFQEFLTAYTMSSFFSKAWPSLVYLVARPWSGRTWIMQEYASSYANSTLIYCGHQAITGVQWDAFLRVWDGSQPHLDLFQLAATENFKRLLDLRDEQLHVVEPSLPVDEVQELHQSWLNGMGNWYNLEVVKMDAEENQRSLLTWVRSARSTIATDPRDKIYAPLGFLKQHAFNGPNSLPDCDIDVLINDYDAPVHDIYASFVRGVVSATRKLDILADCFRISNHVHSTWVPDWTQPEVIHVLGSEFQRRLKGWHAANDTAAITNFIDDFRILTVRGIRVQTLRKKFIRDTRDKVQQVMDFLWTCKESLITRGESENNAIEILWQAFFVFFQIEKPSDDREEKCFRSWLSHNLTSIEERRIPQLQGIEMGREFLYRAIEEVRYLGLTDECCVGRFPSNSKPGDMICVMLGSDAPLLLRPVDEHFELIGACYVDGLMFGEGFKGTDQANLEDFEIH